MMANHLTLSGCLQELKKGQTSSVQLVNESLAGIKKYDKQLKAFVTVTSESALEAAKASDELIAKGVDWTQKPLLGVPVAIKDNFCTKGVRTTASANVLKNFIPPYSATVVSRLIEAGAILVGKTNMDAWAHGSSTETSDFFTTHNPWNLDHLPGGSSGGSAAAVVAGLVPLAIGSETAGSIRQPASWCGVTGLKPTYGRVSRYGVVAMCSSTDSPGLMTRTAVDAGLVLGILAGTDNKDATLSPREVEDYLPQTSRKKLIFGLPKQYFNAKISGEVVRSVREAIKVLTKLGHQTVEVDLMDPELSVAVYTIAQRSEVSSNLGRYDGVRFGFGRDRFGSEAKRRVMLGTYALSAGYYDQYYAKAQKVRTKLIEDFERVFKKVDLLISPTTPTTALKVGASKDQSMFGELQDILVEASSLAGLPGINLPCGFDTEGLPIGMQIIG
ncbi:aspartyl/glutamyl-tRNA amidotransferase subunit A, partial [Patescibacteria group bacterium]|nr:aspartyl/glutamyl-tRNA amidotransferase subunit A [Patescibacteria group bacterium]